MSYPDKFSEVDMPKTVSEFYRTLYGLNESVIEKHLMPAF